MTTKEKASTVHQKYARDKTKEASQNHNLDLILRAQALDKIYQEKGTNFAINHKITPRHMYRLQTKKSLRDWPMHCSPSKVLQLCSFRIVQKRQREVILQAFFLFLPTKLLFQPINKSFSKYGRTHKILLHFLIFIDLHQL